MPTKRTRLGMSSFTLKVMARHPPFRMATAVYATAVAVLVLADTARPAGPLHDLAVVATLPVGVAYLSAHVMLDMVYSLLGPPVPLIDTVATTVALAGSAVGNAFLLRQLARSLRRGPPSEAGPAGRDMESPARLRIYDTLVRLDLPATPVPTFDGQVSEGDGPRTRASTALRDLTLPTDQALRRCREVWKRAGHSVAAGIRAATATDADGYEYRLEQRSDHELTLTVTSPRLRRNSFTAGLVAAGVPQLVLWALVCALYAVASEPADPVLYLLYPIFSLLFTCVLAVAAAGVALLLAWQSRPMGQGMLAAILPTALFAIIYIA